MIRSLRTLALAAAFTLLATPLYAGPPWISAEFPANPHDQTTRGAFLLVHTYHHGTPGQFGLAGTAEGIVNGRRQSVRLEIVPTSKSGVFAVKFAPRPGTWVLAFNLGEREAGMLVTVGTSGEPVAVKVPSTPREGGRWIVPRAVTSDDIEAALRAQTAMAEPGRQLGSLGLPMALALGATILLAVRRRSR